MRVGLSRSFHSGRVSLAFRKSVANTDGGASTPRKSSGEFRWFEDAAPYSKFGQQAPVVTNDKISISVATPDLLESATSGQLVSWPGEIQAKLHHLGSFKPSQQNELFRSHVSLIRRETQLLWSKLLKEGKSSLISGDAGIGKTVLLSQAHAAAKLQGWGVVHVPRTEKLLDGSSDAVLDKSTNIWNQPMFVSRLWKKTVKGNRELLGDRAKQSVTTLSQIVEQFDGKVLVTIDNINALNQQVYALNVNEKNEKLYHNDLEVVNTILKWIEKPAKNTAVVAATGGNFKPINWKGYAYAPLTDYDPELVAKLAKAERLDLGHLDKTEAVSYVDYLHAAEITSKPWEELYQSGNGNPRSILATATNFAY